ncbi:hypothetical protein BDV18DRAFT_28925 [Aspergillus unguis]
MLHNDNNSDFLPAQPPANAKCRKIDFATTDPPLPEYTRWFAAIIDNALTEAECTELIRQAEASTPDGSWDRALINAGGGRQVLSVDSRHCGRIILDSPELTEKLQARLAPFLKELGIDRLEDRPFVTGLAGRKKTYRFTRFNERLRFLKYVGGEYFRPHWDAHYMSPDKKEKSWFTVHLYLNGDGEQDLEELKRANEGLTDETPNMDPAGKLLGGATSFTPRIQETERLVRVFPKAGSVLVFQQNELMHSGDPVFQGTKHTLRTDVMYEQI